MPSNGVLRKIIEEIENDFPAFLRSEVYDLVINRVHEDEEAIKIANKGVYALREKYSNLIRDFKEGGYSAS